MLYKLVNASYIWLVCELNKDRIRVRIRVRAQAIVRLEVTVKDQF